MSLERTEGIRKQAGELIEQAYQRGYKAGENSQIDECAKALDEAVIAGRDEAWEAAKKIDSYCGNNKPLDEMFGEHGIADIKRHFTASEAIEKLRKYEEKKKQEKDEIKVGDEVTYTFHNGRSITPFVVFKIECLEDGGKYYTGLETSTMKCVCGGLDYVKTGRTFPEIVELLKKMQEGENDQ